MAATKARTAGREDRELTREQRPTRIPVSGNRDVLTVYNKEDGYFYRWVLDRGNRIEIFKQGGYEVAPDNGLMVGDARLATTNEHGSAVIAKGHDGQPLVLMRIKKEWYDEDQDAKSEEIEAMENSMKSANQNRADGKYGSFYMGDKPSY